MASPIKLGISPKYGSQSGYITDIMIANSATIWSGGAVRIKAGGVESIDATTERIAGVCMGVGQDGIPIDDLNAGDYDGTYTATQKKYEASSDNETVDLVKAKILINPIGVWSFLSDATLNTTDTSDQIGASFSINTSTPDRVEEGTATTTVMQIFSLGTDPEDTTKRILGFICETQVPQRSDQGVDA